MDEDNHEYLSVYLASKTSSELGTYRLRNKNVDLHRSLLCTGGCTGACVDSCSSL